MEVIQSIQNRIHEIRGERVMLDFDLAALYEVETKALNQAGKRNIARFPLDFMFQLTQAEWAHYRSQIVTTYGQSIDFQLINNQSKRGYLLRPYAFTEQGIAMLSVCYVQKRPFK